MNMTMKKIKRIKDIKEEKIKLRMKELELEKGIRNNWLELKEKLRPVNFLQNKLATFKQEEAKDDKFWAGIISFSLDFLAKKIAKTITKKMESTTG